MISYWIRNDQKNEGFYWCSVVLSCGGKMCCERWVLWLIGGRFNTFVFVYAYNYVGCDDKLNHHTEISLKDVGCEEGTKNKRLTRASWNCTIISIKAELKTKISLPNPTYLISSTRKGQVDRTCIRTGFTMSGSEKSHRNTLIWIFITCLKHLKKYI